MYRCILQCMTDPQIYQTWLFLIDHWSLYAMQAKAFVGSQGGGGGGGGGD